MTIAEPITRARKDADYKAKLLSDPDVALDDVGVEVPASMESRELRTGVRM